MRRSRRSTDLQPLALAVRGQVDLRQGDVGALGRRVLLEEPLQQADRVVGLAAVDEDEREVVRGLAVARALLQRLPEVGLGAVQLALPPQDETEVVEGLGEVGLELQGLLVELAGLGSRPVRSRA